MTGFAPGLPSQVETDPGLRLYARRVYGRVAAGLGVSGLVAAAIAYSPPLQRLLLAMMPGWTLPTGFGLALFAAPVILLLAASAASDMLSVRDANRLYWALSVLVGGAVAMVGFACVYDALFLAFFATAGSFAGFSVMGERFGRRPSGPGAFLTIGLVGMAIVAGLCLSLRTGPLGLLVNMAAVAVFTGLIAFGGQRLEACYRKAVRVNDAALGLFLSTIQLFQPQVVRP